ncbi:MAG TPA: hypothetical protein PKY87_07075 [Terricaulis sp.]|nr:hypothetical protein [Terricaulis sp.]
MNRGGILQRMRSAGLLLALYALVFKAMLPPDFMLEAHQNGVAIVLCNGANALLDPLTGAIAPDADQEKDGDSASQHCPFAMANAPVLNAPFAVSAPTHSAGLQSGAPEREVITPREATGPPLPARGPPLPA